MLLKLYCVLASKKSSTYLIGILLFSSRNTSQELKVAQQIIEWSQRETNLCGEYNQMNARIIQTNPS